MKTVISLQEWLSWYKKIAEEFGFHPSKDQLAADVLSRLISHRAIHPQTLKNLVSNRFVLIFGAGPSLEENVSQLAEGDLLRKFITISADGATSALLKVAKTFPNVVVSDLDGNLRDLVLASQLGSIMVIHGHGDNINRLNKFVPLFDKVLGTTQVEPRPCVYNFGGFTDGDRAVFLATAMGARLIVVAGMDLGEIIGEYSKKYVKSVGVKILKLKYCKKLLELLASRVNIPLYNISGRGESINGFINVKYSDLEKMLN